jgi:tetratricopeptide (TPR) repeat protein
MPIPSSTRRRVLATSAIVGGLALLVSTVTALFGQGREEAAATRPEAAAESALNRTISSAQDKLRHSEHDPATWAVLGSAYVEQARITADPGFYGKAQGALEKSLAQQPEANGPALIGLGALANARHDFVTAKDWGERARAVLPDTVAVYGVLADAYTQLGDSAAATGAVQRMLDLKPGLSAFTRASYDLEQHGQLDQAREALSRALDDATAPADIVFCQYYLGELAYNSGQLDDASAHYEKGLAADPQDVALRQGRAKIAFARGQVDPALAEYRDIVSRVPLPQYLQEYATLLRAAGRTDEATKQYDLLAAQEKLFAAAGVTDDLAAAMVAADRGDAAEALRRAEAEWGRRHNPLVADAYAWALHLNGRDAEALGFADQALALGWQHAGFTFHRGMILASLGRADEAITALDQALRLNPHFSPVDAPTAQQTLQTLRSGR